MRSTFSLCFHLCYMFLLLGFSVSLLFFLCILLSIFVSPCHCSLILLLFFNPCLQRAVKILSKIIVICVATREFSCLCKLYLHTLYTPIQFVFVYFCYVDTHIQLYNSYKADAKHKVSIIKFHRNVTYLM